MVHGLRRPGLTAGLALALALLVAAPAGGQTPSQPVDRCTGTDHFPAEPATNEVTGQTTQSPSIWIVGLAFGPPPPPGTPVEVVTSGPSGTQTGGALTDDAGIVVIDVPAFQYGTHQVDSLEVDGQPVELAEPIVHTIDDGEPPCDASLLTAAPPPTTTTTAAPTTSTTAEPTTTTSAATSTTATAGDDGDADGGDSDLPWLVLVAIGLGIGVAGLFLLFGARSSDPCAELLRAWLAAQAACARARARAEAAEADAERAADRRRQAEESLDALRDEWPPLEWDDDGEGSWMELSGVPGSRITQRDVWLGQQHAKAAWDRYRANPGPESAEQLMEEWRDADTSSMRDELREKDQEYRAKEAQAEAELDQATADEARARADADAARAEADAACAGADAAGTAYLDRCGGAAAAGTGQGGATGAGAGTDAGGGTTPGPTPDDPRSGSPCTTGDTRPPTVLATFGPRNVLVDFSVMIVSEGYRRGDEALATAEELKLLGAHLDFLGTLLGIRDIVKAPGSLGAAMEGGAAIADVPTSPLQAATEVLEFTAELSGQLAERFGVILNAAHELYTVRIVEYVRQVHMEWREQWTCVDGAWQCRRILWREMGPMRRGAVQERTALTQAEAGRQAEGARRRRVGTLQGVQSDVTGFMTRYEGGDCGC